MSVSALHELELSSGRRVVLLDDRGWTSEAMGPRADVWAHTTVDSVVNYARMVVGPDEPADGCTQEQAAADHWAQLSARAREHGVAVAPEALAALPHDVDVSEDLRARLGRSGR